jgi:surface antigen
MFINRSRSRTNAVRLLTATLATFAIAAGALLSAPAASAIGSDDYPAKWKNHPRDAMFDDWGMYNRECVSWVAWTLHNRNKFEMPFHANAEDWGAKAKKLGYRVDHTPTVGSVAWWSTNHVAWVEAVNTNGTVTVSEYNIGGKGKYDTATFAATRPSGYIHFKDMAVDVSSGAFVQYGTRVYRIAGGAPLYVPNWQDLTPRRTIGALSATAWAKLAPRPADGTYITAMPSGTVYRIVGGAPLAVANWDALGGTKPTVKVSDEDIAHSGTTIKGSPWAHLRYYPLTGTYLTTGAADSLKIYQVTSGVADPVADWAAVGGVKPSVQVDPAAISKAGATKTSAWGHLVGRIPPLKIKLAGSPLVGHTISVSVASTGVSGVSLRYVWKRNGVVINGHTSHSLTMKKAYVGASITVTVVATKSNFRGVTKASTPRVVRTQAVGV